MDLTPHSMPGGGVRYGEYAYAAEAMFQGGEARRKRESHHRPPKQPTRWTPWRRPAWNRHQTLIEQERLGLLTLRSLLLTAIAESGEASAKEAGS